VHVYFDIVFSVGSGYFLEIKHILKFSLFLRFACAFFLLLYFIFREGNRDKQDYGEDIT
jgi:hypothetical protein